MSSSASLVTLANMSDEVITDFRPHYLSGFVENAQIAKFIRDEFLKRQNEPLLALDSFQWLDARLKAAQTADKDPFLVLCQVEMFGHNRIETAHATRSLGSLPLFSFTWNHYSNGRVKYYVLEHNDWVAESFALFEDLSTPEHYHASMLSTSQRALHGHSLGLHVATEHLSIDGIPSRTLSAAVHFLPLIGDRFSATEMDVGLSEADHDWTFKAALAVVGFRKQPLAKIYPIAPIGQEGRPLAPTAKRENWFWNPPKTETLDFSSGIGYVSVQQANELQRLRQDPSIQKPLNEMKAEHAARVQSIRKAHGRSA